ncbi:MAG: alcohol dehydrogenase catalytic domain-containing protein [Solirubrobacteraceae bacterium]
MAAALESPHRAQSDAGRILGHEGVGTITEVGSSVTKLAVGDNVIISCIKSCGYCSFCQTFQMATEIVRPGGHVANVGVHGRSVDLQLQNLWIQNISISMGLVNSNTTPLLLKLVASGKLNIDNFETHHFALHDMMDAYDTFARAAETYALKVIIDR